MANFSGFDDPGVFFSDNFGYSEFMTGGDTVNVELDKVKIKNRSMEMIRSFQSDNVFIYRDALRRNYTRRRYFLRLDLSDVAAFDQDLFDKIQNHPNDLIPLLEEAARDMVYEVMKTRGNHATDGAERVDDDEPMMEDEDGLVRNDEQEDAGAEPGQTRKARDVQITFSWRSNAFSIRQLTADKVSTLVKVTGIVVSASSIRCKARRMTLQCRHCQSTLPNIHVKPGLEGFPLPRRCVSDQTGQAKCPLDPYFVIPDKCQCVDFQQLKLQELPENVPTGEMPRHMLLYADRFLTDLVVPGNRIAAIGVFSIRKMQSETHRTAKVKSNVGIRAPYLRLLGISQASSAMEDESRDEADSQNQAAGDHMGVADGLSARVSSSTGNLFSPVEVDEFRRIAAGADAYERIAKSLAPSIYGLDDVKKAVACLLFGGSRKRLPDGLYRRGDINLLLIGDPGTAKSQLLKFVERVAPISVYTSGKGSSAAGLTASIIRDPQSGNFVVEGGAMVLADGGVVCIDEFDKMREDDRVAIHEAMEQQTISIAKAGITSTLNTRCSVLAAANSVYGRWDDLKGASNIDFMPTILSRFDMIFIMKDEHDDARDTDLARHVIRVHMNVQPTVDASAQQKNNEGELTIGVLKKYIAFCRSHIFPRLTAQAAERLKNQYVLMRSGAFQYEQEIGKRLSVTITVRQLEALVRISESLARMRMSNVATEDDVNEALRLFTVSTYTTAVSGKLAGIESMTSREELDELNKIERQIKKRFVIGSQVSEHAVVQDLIKQGLAERLVFKVIHTMIRRGELQHRVQRKMLFRIR